MSNARTNAVLSLLQRSGLGVHPRDWRLPPIETYAAVIAFAQTYAGKLVLFAAFLGLMKLVSTDMWIAERSNWLWMSIGAALVSLAGSRRRDALLVCTALLLVRYPDWIDFSAVHTVLKQEALSGRINTWYLRAATLIACVPIAALAMHMTRYYRNHPVGRHPLLIEHVLYFCVLGLAASHLLNGAAQVLAWSFLAAFSSYFWYMAYALIDQRHRQPTPMLFHFATFGAFNSSTVIPVGKGAANWASLEARTAHDLAVTQLKGLKLLVWALILKEGVLRLLNWAVHEQLGIPTLKLAFEQYLQSGDAAFPHGLLSILANFPERLLVVAIGGHVVIATVRLAGFRLLRNTYRPLSARSIADFWNRYLYYFKEIMVHVYFYPTYVRWFKRHPRLRLAFATFMAAGVGNFFFHFMDITAIASAGLGAALMRMQTYGFYCVVLSAGIIISQLRSHKPDPNLGWMRSQFLPSLGVAVFFCLLSFFDGPQRHVSLAQHFDFLFRVLGIVQWIKATG